FKQIQMKAFLVFLTFILSLSYSQAQSKLSTFYKSRIPVDKEFYIGIIWDEGVDHSINPPKYQFEKWKFYRMQLNELENHYNQGFIKQIYLPVDHARILNDSVRVQVGANKIHEGIEPVPQSFEGKDIIYGYVDTGIDYNHADFMNSDSSTRVMYYWDQSKPNNTSTP